MVEKSDWAKFVEDVEARFPSFRGDGGKRAGEVLKSMGHKGFSKDKLDLYSKDLEEWSESWHRFVARVATSNPRMYTQEWMVRQAIATKFGEIDLERQDEMFSAAQEYMRDWIAAYKWASPCPVCGAPTVRVTALDRIFGHDEPYGWECTKDPHDGPSHFAQSVVISRKNRNKDREESCRLKTVDTITRSPRTQGITSSTECLNVTA